MGNYSFKCPDGGQQALDDIKDLLLEMLDEMKNDDNFTDSLWENEDGDVVVKRIIRADDGTITTEFLNADGTPYTGSTSSLIPYSRDVIAVSSDYCANMVPYTVIELRDHDTKDLITRIFRNDNDFTESLTAPAGLTKGLCMEADSTVVKYQPVDCDGVNVGAEVDATNVKIVNATEVFCAIVNAIDSAKDAIVDAVNQANTDITNAIENSIMVLEDIKSELVTANTTLTNIETNTTNINTKLDTVIGKIDVMITSLSSIDTKLTTTNELLADILVDIGNIGGDLADILTAVQSIDIKLDDVISSLSSIETKLDTLHTDLVGIQDTLNDILAELDHELIITAPTVNCATDGANKVSFYTREKIVWDSEAGTQVSRVVEYSLDGEDFSASKPAGTVSVGACVLSGDITDTLVEFQVEDCDGADVGAPMDVLPTIVLNKQIVSICNVQELADAINAGAKDYTSVLESIDTKLDELTLIKSELIQSNTTLTEIETNTSETNTKLDTVIIKLDEQITELEGIKLSIDVGNIKLDEIFAKLEDILISVDAIKVDIADIKINIEAIKVAVESIDTKLDTVITSLTEIENKLDSVVTELQTINTTLQTEFDETQVILNEIKDAILSKGSDCANATFTKDCDRQELIDTLEAVNTLVLDFEKTYCGTANGVNTEYLIRQFSDYNTATKVKTARPLEYSEDGLTWTETEPADTTFVLGSCPIEIPEPYCIENVSYNLVGNKGMILEANKVFEYDALVYSGGATYEEKNKVLKGEAGYSWGNGDVELMKLLPNRVLIANTSSDSDTRISVMQICGYEPIMADTIDGGLVLLASAVPNATNDAILVTFNDVPAATGYRVFRYVKGANPNTKIQLTDWTEGTANPLITDNGDGTYTYNDGTAVLGTDYMYYYEAYNAVSQGFSNTTEASLLPTTFEPVMRTTASNETVTLPMTVSSPVTIDWGDGTTTTQGAPFTKVYATPGDYHIKVNITQSREVTNFIFNGAGDRLKLIDIRNWGWVKLGTAGRNFWGCSNLEIITAKDVPTGLTNMDRFFTGCSKLTSIDNLANWDTSNVTNMLFMFHDALVFNQSVSNFDTSKVTNMAGMFYNARAFNQSVSNFDTSLVTNMGNMFQGALVFNQSVSNFDTSLATNMSNMFQGALVFNQSVSNFDTSLVTNMGNMFDGARAFNQSVSNFNTANVTNMSAMFRNAWAFNQSVSNFDTAKVTNMAGMFNNARAFNQSVSNFNTANVTNFGSMFESANVFNQPVPFNTAKATNMISMFSNAFAFNQAINFNIPLVTNMLNFIAGSAMNTTNVDNMLIGFAGQTTQNNINLNNFRPRTSLSDAAKATLVSRGWSASGW
jgi:surface protein